MVLLNVAWMHTTPCGTTRFSRFLRNSFFRLAAFAPAAGAAASCSFATMSFLSCASQVLLASHHFLLSCYRALPGALAGARVGVGALAAHWKVPAMTQAAVALNFDQPPDVHLHLFAEIALHAPFRLDGSAQARDFLFREIFYFLDR